MFRRRMGRSLQAICFCVIMMIAFTGCRANLDVQTEPTENRTDSPSHNISETEKDPLDSSRKIEVISFDLRVLETSWSDNDWQMPVLLSTYDEYEQYLQHVLADCVWEADYQYTNEAKFLAEYEKKWFNSNGLLMLPIKHSDWSYAHEVEVTLFDESGRLEINVIATHPEEEIYPIESYWLIVMELEKSELETVTKMSVSLSEAIDETQIVLKTETHLLNDTFSLKSDENAPRENVLTFRSREELDAFCDQIEFTTQESEDELKVLTDGYQEAWFEENMLIFIRMTAPATGYDFDLRLVRNTGTDKIRMELFEHHEGILFHAPESFLFVVEVSKTENEGLDKITGYEGCRIYTGFN